MALKITDSYLPVGCNGRPGTRINPTKIAVHYVGNPGSSAKGNRNYFASGVYASSHYIIGLDGEILRLIPENEMSYATNQANSYTISIESCHPDATGKFNDKTLNSLIELCADICKRHKMNPLTDIIRHYDVTKKCCPRWWSPNGPNKNANIDFTEFKNSVKKAMTGTTKPAPSKAAKTKITNYADAVKTLASVKIINSPQYWYDAEKTINYIDALIINSANAIYTTQQNNINDINTALLKLKEKKVLTTTEYWADACVTNNYLVSLIIAIAKYV